MKENWGQILAQDTPRGVRDWSASNTINDPISPMVVQFGPNGSAQQNREWTNAENIFNNHIWYAMRTLGSFGHCKITNFATAKNGETHV